MSLKNLFGLLEKIEGRKIINPECVKIIYLFEGEESIVTLKEIIDEVGWEYGLEDNVLNLIKGQIIKVEVMC